MFLQRKNERHYEERKIKKVYFFHNNLRREDKFLKLTFDIILKFAYHDSDVCLF